MILKLEIGDLLHLRKPHPCGSEEWEVLKTGVDVRIKCCGCGRVVLIPRDKLLKSIRVKKSDSIK
ncbi:MAG: DUF951 domain-containing protein [Bacillota bacterium]